MSSSSVTQFVRAGACTQGQFATAHFLECALQASDCTAGATFWASQELAQALVDNAGGTFDVPAAKCLTADETNALLTTEQCNANTNLGACLVGESIYQCAVSEAGCGSDATYVPSASVLANTDIMCQICGLDASMDGDYSDLTTPSRPVDGGADGADGDYYEDGGYYEDYYDGADGDYYDGEDGDYYEGDDNYYDETTDPTTDSAASPGGTMTTTTAATPSSPGGFGSVTTTTSTNPTAPTGFGGITTTTSTTPAAMGEMDSSDDMENKTNTTGSLLDEYQALDENEKVEAGVVVGIVIGILLGCGLLLYIQRLFRKCCGGDPNGIDKQHQGRQLVGEDMGHVTSDDDDDFEDRML